MEDAYTAAAASTDASSEPSAPLPPPRLLVFQEGFSAPGDLTSVDQRVVDAVFVGEELLPIASDANLKDEVQAWYI